MQICCLEKFSKNSIQKFLSLKIKKILYIIIVKIGDIENIGFLRNNYFSLVIFNI